MTLWHWVQDAIYGSKEFLINTLGLGLGFLVWTATPAVFSYWHCKKLEHLEISLQTKYIQTKLIVYGDKRTNRLTLNMHSLQVIKHISLTQNFTTCMGFIFTTCHRLIAESYALENLVTHQSQKFWLSCDCPYMLIVHLYAKRYVLKNKRVTSLPWVDFWYWTSMLWL